jgi:hypothetical protein
MNYVNDLNPEPVDRLTELLFKPFKAQFKRDLMKWEAKSQQARDAINKRWNPDTDIRTYTDESKPIRKDTVKDKVKDKVKDSINSSPDIPTLEEFIAHAKDRHPLVSTKIVSTKYYTWVDNDWLDGYNKPIIRWKSKLTNTLKHESITKEKKFKFDQSKSKHL